MIYLDNHSTTKCDERVIKAMEPYYSVNFGNSSSAHEMGEIVKEAVEKARYQVASVIKANPEHVYFTNSATEANNIILKGFANKNQSDYIRIISTNSEHSSILKTLETINKQQPYTNQYNLEIDKDGNIDLDRLIAHIRSAKNFHHPVKVLVSIIAANNEIGTIHDLEKVGDVCKYSLFHTDATQAIGRVKIDVEKMNIFALTMSAHKIYGPKGVGALYIKDTDLIEPLIDGGYQNTITSGTQNIPAIVGFGKACELIGEDNENNRIRDLRDYLLHLLQKGIPDLIVNGTMNNRLPNNLNVTIPRVPSEALIKGMDDIMVSGGAACMTGELEPSHVIKALNSPHPECAIRFGIGRYNNAKEIEYATNKIINIVKSIRS